MIKSKKTVLLGNFSTEGLGGASGFPQPATRKEYAKNPCRGSHRWVERKYTKHCSRCGVEEAK